MSPEDNIRVLRRTQSAAPVNIFELLDQEEERKKELEAWHERRKNRVPAQGKTKTAELNDDNRGYIWARRQKPLPPRSGKNDA